MAIDDSYKNASGDTIENTCYVNCVCWGRRGEVLSERFQKGRQILIRGKLQFQQWETEDGQKRNALKVVVDEWKFCGNKVDSQQYSNNNTGGQGKSGFDEVPGSQIREDINEEDIPF
jgi:single-strand DNA-binding protein